MQEEFQISEYYQAIGEALIDKVSEFESIKECNTRICYMTSTKEKKHDGKLTFAECSKVKKREQMFCPYDYIITVYLPCVAHLNEHQMDILIAHELLHIDAKLTDAGPEFGIRPHDFADFEWIVQRYGLWWDELGLTEEQSNELEEATKGIGMQQRSLFDKPEADTSE